MIWESFLDKTVDSDVLDLRETRAKEAKVKTKKQQNIGANVNIEAERAPIDTKKSSLETEEARNYTKEGKHSAEEAKVILLKTQKKIWRSHR